MKILLRLFPLAILLTSCGSTEMWVPIASTGRTAVPFAHVQYLEAPPQRAHVIIGIITPPNEEYETYAELVKAMRKQAAKHGADAIYIESHTEVGGWRFSIGGFGRASGEEHPKDVTYRAKAIVWK